MPRLTPWCFGIGVLCFHVLPRVPAAGWATLPVLIALLALRWRRMRWLLLAAVGFTWAWLRVDLRLHERWPDTLSSEPVVLEGVVVAQPALAGPSLQCVIDADTVDGVTRSVRARLSWYDPPAEIPRPGERWRLRVRLRPPRGFANPGGFDYEGWLFREGVGATGYVLGGSDNQRIAGPRGRYLLLGWRAAIASRMEDMAGASAHAGVISALVVGLTGGLGSHDWEVFQATGTSHLISISGLHIGLVAGGVAWVVRRGWGRLACLRRRLAPIDAAALGGLLAAAVYSLLAGFSIPTLRSLLMLAVVLGRSLLRREGTAEASLAQAFGIVLLFDPLAPLFPGFWLSFLCVAALMLGMMGGVTGLNAHLRTQWAVTLVVAPVTLAIFDSLSLIAPLVNLVLIPIFSVLVVPPALAAALLLPLSEALSALPLSLAVGTIDCIWPWLARAAALPIALWTASPRPFWVLLAAQLGLLLCVVPRGLVSRWLAVPLVLPLLMWHPPAPVAGAYELAVLDVGQGLAVVVRTAHHVLLYDTGPRFRSGGDAGRMVVVPYLHARGVRALDALIVSHDDSDHSGGVRSILGAVRVARVLTGGRGEAERCVAGRRWRWDDVDFELLHPAAGARWSDNDGSCVLRVSAPGGTSLFTGDIEVDGERALIDSAQPLASDIVVAPHHGSASSSSAGLIARTHPRHVVFSAGYENRWGFPAAAVQARWRAAGAALYSTESAGALIFMVDPHRGVLPPYEHRRDGRHYWTAP